MAEHSFQEVMKQWRRFCRSHRNCGECEFDGKGICGEAHLSNVPYSDIELRIMAWAAEHPEPVYPTWVEWLLEQDVASKRPGFRFEEDGMYENYLTAYAFKPIPADIAQKLGLEPKEG